MKIELFFWPGKRKSRYGPATAHFYFEVGRKKTPFIGQFSMGKWYCTLMTKI
ncbi:hypothetical protein [Maribacter sp. 2307ULW6-5]|uniref:hypothetical protein n=1 Tax=Maribacter sp. 2307ULW6-5 TaxID=3386275 RepID=UPI0039BCF27E